MNGLGRGDNVNIWIIQDFCINTEPLNGIDEIDEEIFEVACGDP